MIDWVMEDMRESIKLQLRETARKMLKKSSKKELIEFILDNIDLLRTKPEDYEFLDKG